MISQHARPRHPAVSRKRGPWNSRNRWDEYRDRCLTTRRGWRKHGHRPSLVANGFDDHAGVIRNLVNRIRVGGRNGNAVERVGIVAAWRNAHRVLSMFRLPPD